MTMHQLDARMKRTTSALCGKLANTNTCMSGALQMSQCKNSFLDDHVFITAWVLPASCRKTEALKDVQLTTKGSANIKAPRKLACPQWTRAWSQISRLHRLQSLPSRYRQSIHFSHRYMRQRMVYGPNQTNAAPSSQLSITWRLHITGLGKGELFDALSWARNLCSHIQRQKSSLVSKTQSELAFWCMDIMVHISVSQIWLEIKTF